MCLFCWIFSFCRAQKKDSCIKQSIRRVKSWSPEFWTEIFIGPDSGREIDIFQCRPFSQSFSLKYEYNTVILKIFTQVLLFLLASQRPAHHLWKIDGSNDDVKLACSTRTKSLPTANLKTESHLNQTGETFWFIAASVARKTQTMQRYAPTAGHRCTPSVKSTQEASKNTTEE